MKKSVMVSLISAAAAIIVAIPVELFSAQLSFYVGDVTLTRDAKKIFVSVGLTVESGDVITTKKNSTAEISYDDGTKITILHSSTVRIGSRSIKGSNDIAVISGSISGKFAKLKKNQRNVYTPTMVCSVRGTEFGVTVSRGGDSRVDLTEGKLKLGNPYGSVNLIENGKAEGIVGSSPADDSMGGSEQWKISQDKNFESDPSRKSGQYSGYMKKFSERGSETEKTVKVCSGLVGDAKNKKEIKKAGKKIRRASSAAKDDLMLNETANGAIGLIVENLNGKDDVNFNSFKRIKDESDIVLEQQKKNYEALNEVREAHRRAYDEIINQYKKDKEEIFKGLSE